ncbi:MAG TPA: adenylosuccinate lyase [Candidatus Saccharimonadales bacterium]|nr:adenylosuccinate lyase [Candidatus Saccharimonadales bacterium]
MTDSFTYSTYLSPFTTRYGSSEMRHIWSEEFKRQTWRKVWVALAKAEEKQGLLTKEELADITSHQQNIDIPRAKEREKEIYHELMAEIQTFAEQCKIGGGKIHVGATSTDILDNTTVIQIKKSLRSMKQDLKELLTLFAQKIEEHANTVCMGYTHLQPAEPTTLGYRLSFYAQDLLMDLAFLEKIEPMILGKGIKGAVGTSASYVELLGSEEKAMQLEKDVLETLGIEAVLISHQTYPRKIDLLVIELLSNVAASLYKFAFDFRIMQSPLIGEWMEKRNAKRVGSSAMPFKRNPDKAEKVCSLCRYVSSHLQSAWANPANSLLERTLDDSASQRLFLPESFLAIDEAISTVKNLLTNLEISQSSVNKNLETFGQFAGTEVLLMRLVSEKHADRQKIHELIKSCSMKVWQGRDSGQEISLVDTLFHEKEISQHFSKDQLQKLLDPSSHIGLAKRRTYLVLNQLKKLL